MPIKAIILDCDGVILDSNEAYEHVFEKLCKKYGVPETKKQIEHHFGEKPKKILQELFHKHDVNKVYREYIKVISSKAFLRHIKIMPKAKQTLKTLGKKYRLVLATGALHISLVPALRKFRLKKYFNFIVTGDDVKIAKPNPEIILKPIKKLGLKRNEVIYIGDAPNDVTSAKRAGVKIVTVLTGVLSRKEAKRLKADFVVSDISKIGKILKGLNR